MNLRDMHPRKRREVISLALDFALQDLAAPASTYDLVRTIAGRLSTDERDFISRALVQLAPLYPEAKRGEAFEKFGRGMRRWIWSPRRATATATVEDSDW